MRLEASDFDKANYAAAAVRAKSGTHGWVGVIVSGEKGSSFPPNIIEHRLSAKAFETQREAVEFAENYLYRVKLRAFNPA